MQVPLSQTLPASQSLSSWQVSMQRLSGDRPSAASSGLLAVSTAHEYVCGIVRGDVVERVVARSRSAARSSRARGTGRHSCSRRSGVVLQHVLARQQLELAAGRRARPCTGAATSGTPCTRSRGDRLRRSACTRRGSRPGCRDGRSRCSRSGNRNRRASNRSRAAARCRTARRRHRRTAWSDRASEFRRHRCTSGSCARPGRSPPTDRCRSTASLRRSSSSPRRRTAGRTDRGTLDRGRRSARRTKAR